MTLGTTQLELASPRALRTPTERRDRRRIRIASGLGLFLGGLVFFLTLLNYGRDLTRTAVAPGYFSHFFDVQGRAILDGRLRVPEGSLGIEGFLHDGHTYTYFPPWPSLLRMPVLMTTDEFDGRLTVLSMAVAWVVLAVMVTKLIWLLLRLFSVHEEVTRTKMAVAAIFIAGATGGTFLTFDASLPWVYHEVYLWAATAAIGAIYWMIRVLLRPDMSSLRWLFVFALIAIGTRATEGWAIALVLIALGIFVRFRPYSDLHRARWWVIVAAGAVPLAISILINEIKFGTVFMFPLQDQVWTEISPRRQRALAANDGTLTGIQFFPSSFMAYLRPDGIRFTDVFPFITLPAEPARSYGGAVIDQTYRTGSATAFMPLFMLLELVAVVAAFWPRTSAVLRRLRWPLVAGVLITGGVMAYGYYANRYTSEFVPALVTGGAIGIALVTRWLEQRRRGLRLAAVPTMALAVLFSLLAQAATGMTQAAVTARASSLERYVGWQHDLTPGALADRAELIDTRLPSAGSTDDLAIYGQCEAMFLNTGDLYEPWVVVEERDQLVRLSFSPQRLRTGEAELARTTTHQGDYRLSIQVNEAGKLRYVFDQDGEVTTSFWFDAPTDGKIDIGFRNLVDYNFYEIDSSLGDVIGYLPSGYNNKMQDARIAPVDFTWREAQLDDLGITAVTEVGSPLRLCESIAGTAGIDLPDPQTPGRTGITEPDNTPARDD